MHTTCKRYAPQLITIAMNYHYQIKKTIEIKMKKKTGKGWWKKKKRKRSI